MFFFGGARLRMLLGSGPTEELLDRPLSNFDVLGIPTGAWSSGLLECHQNIVPSCVLSFFCPCVMWAQIVVRAQIPLLISTKNAIHQLRSNSGYGAFVEFFFWTALVSIALLIVILVLHGEMPSIVTTLLGILLIGTGGGLICVLAHTRTAFREKYELPSFIPLRGASFWDNTADLVGTVACLPCVLAQMARHVFQYDKMDTDIGLYLGDPSALPPLRPTPEQQAAANTNPNGVFERPQRADQAGLGGNSAAQRANTGAAHRQQALEQRQREELIRESATPAVAEYASAQQQQGSAPPIAQAQVVR